MEFCKDSDPDFLYNLANKFHRAIKIIRNLVAPSIAAIYGPFYGVGLSIACACDLRLCSNIAKFGVVFTSLGLSPNSSLTFFLPKIIGLPLANEMALTNRILNSGEAKKNYLVSEVYASNRELMEKA